MIVFIVSTLVVVVVSFLCSMAEAMLLSMDNVKIETDRIKGLRYARIMEKLKSNINRPIAAILILNTIAHTGGTAVAGSSFNAIYGEEWVWVFSIIFTIVILFGTEILPKVLGVANSEKIARFMAVPLSWSIKLLYPFILLTEFFSRLIIRRKETSAKYTLEDIQTIARMAKKEEVIDKDQESIIVNTSALKIKPVSKAMLPIADVIFFQKDISVEEYFELAAKHLHTRYPVSRSNSPQEIIGYLNFKEIALQRDSITSDRLDEFIRPILYVDEKSSVLKVLKELNQKNYHLALVRNQNGENVGMVTLEDIVEEIVGDITDEFDVEEEF